MDTPMMNNPKYEDAIDEVPEDEVSEDGPETVLKKLREEFERYYNCDPDASSE